MYHLNTYVAAFGFGFMLAIFIMVSAGMSMISVKTCRLYIGVACQRDVVAGLPLRRPLHTGGCVVSFPFITSTICGRYHTMRYY
jgi:hypothetical protein